jgi:hypothetical protein
VSTPFSQAEGEDDQGEANDHGEAADKWCQKRHVGSGQDRKEYAK